MSVRDGIALGALLGGAGVLVALYLAYFISARAQAFLDAVLPPEAASPFGVARAELLRYRAELRVCYPQRLTFDDALTVLQKAEQAELALALQTQALADRQVA